MILSKNILPSVMDDTEELYYRIEGEVSFDSDRVCLKEGSVLSLDTFFNICADDIERNILTDSLESGHEED